MRWVLTDDPLVPGVLAHHYGLVAASVARLDRESVNGTFRARTAIGDVVVKRLGRPGTPEWLDYQAGAIDALHSHGFPVEPLMRSVDGRGTAIAEGQQWQVSRFVESRPFQPGSEADADAAASCLDALHELSPRTAEDPPASPVQDVEPWLWAEDADMAELVRTVGEVAPHAAPEICRTYQAVWADAREDLSAEEYFALPRRITHGEFVSSNVLFDGGGVACVVDWDAVQIRPRVSDVARGSLFFARRARGAIEVYQDLVPRFIEGATKSAAMIPAEIAAVIPFLELYFLPSCSYLRALAEHDRLMLDWYLGWSSSSAARVRPLLTPILAVR
ncbi:phosphotransferase enzyme family protein [Streptomyces silvisoli]|uniref:Phosphotransferase n=1 Tax=Streptomyces silvisoli TaxID=3034235 RepID=A0ABT5ZKE1_9ACTN|nr:phosphotransferase [Streptomyces silvisoli]MDF3290298.1 phosphotransferase [Streptomyces silvisoli]